ncbi:hypothetical protein FPY71_10025 [Aureimonas fodinaquatilis]|uniref:Phage protein Gp138 N-terminal domain-containing protein n=1 Tax=Aureimonas fodinaquatilis TaxID=2565783 RepID=A0A5B0DWH7_9HYPH|nr:Gp138 family membrane-puncturing spike protein [Aureimonas fodinaquatilis]KAA0970803.1 hypothetical protein FPY71_10025 [Aureimonas fodinaquatilis]
MGGHIGKTTSRLEDIIDSRIAADRAEQWGEMPGRVVAFDPSTQTATIQPLIKKLHRGKEHEIPALLEVPIRFPRAGGFVITSPIKAGDKVTLRPQMRSTEGYQQDGEGYTAADSRSFSLSDYEAHLEGGESLTAPIQNFNSQNMEIRSADGQFAIEMSEDGKFRMRGAAGNWFTLLAEALRLIGSDELVIAYGSSSGTNHSLANRDNILAIADKFDEMSL